MDFMLSSFKSMALPLPVEQNGITRAEDLAQYKLQSPRVK